MFPNASSILFEFVHGPSYSSLLDLAPRQRAAPEYQIRLSGPRPWSIDWYHGSDFLVGQSCDWRSALWNCESRMNPTSQTIACIGGVVLDRKARVEGGARPGT